MKCIEKRDSLDVIKGQHSKKEDSNEGTKESWVALHGKQTSKSKIEKVPSCLPSNNLFFQE